jgi:predicted MFS family arabinose efflux permease
MAFGAFWGTWGASIPRIRELAQVSDAELGVALLFVGAGALPAMLLSGKAIDRWGLWLAAPLLLALGASGIIVAATAGSGLLVLCAGMSLVGATSGATDVAINSLAGRAERVSGRPLITRAHATFSAVVVVAIALTGLLTSRDATLIAPFSGAAIAGAVACVSIVLASRRRRLTSDVDSVDQPTSAAPGLSIAILVGLGALGALAFAAENAHQSWSALFLEEEFSAPAGLSAFGPAVFAAIVAVTRFSISRVPAQHARKLLMGGALSATLGAGLLALAPTLPLGVAALALAAAGTAVLFPTILGVVSRAVPEHQRARATSVVSTVAYAGFLAGPAYVGFISDVEGLRGAMIAVALLTAAMATLIPAVLRTLRRVAHTAS